MRGGREHFQNSGQAPESMPAPPRGCTLFAAGCTAPLSCSPSIKAKENPDKGAPVGSLERWTVTEGLQQPEKAFPSEAAKSQSTR